MSPRARTLLALTAILILGLALRAWRIGDIPFGLHTDEGHNTLDALRIVEGWRPVFLDRNNGREPLFMVVMAALMAAFGPTIAAARLTGVVAGVLVILGQFVFARGLPLSRPRRVALLSAAFTAFTFWPVAQARYALRAGLLPLWIALMLWAWWKVLDGHDRAALWSTLTGIFLAAAVYTHLTGRLLPVILILSALWVLLRERRPRVLVHLGLALAVALLLALPQIDYFRQHPEMLSHRADQVSAFNPEVNEGNLAGFLAENGWNLVKTPVWEGDASWYHNIKRRPVFGDPLSALAFVAGAVILGWMLLGRRGRRRQTAAVLLLLTLAVTVAPSWLSVGAPNYVRLTGAWPVLFLLPALGLDRMALALARRDLPPWGPGPLWGNALIGLTLVATLASTTYDYFYRYAPRPEVYEAFNGSAVERGMLLRDVVAQGPTYVSPALWQQSVIRFLNSERAPQSFDLRVGLVLPATASESQPAGVRYVFDPVEADAAVAFGARWPDAMRRDLRDERDALSLIVFEFPPELVGRITFGTWPPVPGVRFLHAAFADRFRLEQLQISPDTVAPGGTITVTLDWLALAPTEVDLNQFIHVVSRAEDRTIGQFDGPLLDGSYTTDQWQPGEHIVQSIPIQIAEDAPEGSTFLRLGWYDWRNGQRLPLGEDADSAAEVGEFRVRRGDGD
jgi:4-amino-4-deoxy-L-arabinose transferase-like glycosyltransferase